jgi:hypothetical protein
VGKRSLANDVVGALAITAVVGCGKPFSLDMSVGGSDSSSSDGGGGSMSTSASSSSGLPVICTPGDLTTCDAGKYCKTDTQICTDCSELADFKFGSLTRIELMPPTGTALRFPRIGPSDQLLFTFTSSALSTDIGHAERGDGFLQWKNVVTEPEGINNDQREDGASLYLPKDHGDILDTLIADMTSVQPAEEVVLYHNTTPIGDKKVFAFNPGQAKISLVNLKGTSNSHVAVAYKARRFWYTSNAINSTENLVTVAPGGDPALAQMKDSNACTLQGNLSAWVTPDGKWLLFSSQLHDGSDCSKLADTGRPHLFYTEVDPVTGQQVGLTREIPVDQINDAGHVNPSLSPDLCVLLFTDQSKSPDSELYAAVRE